MITYETITKKPQVANSLIGMPLTEFENLYSEFERAYLDGLGILASKGGSLKQVASVASFFLSRIDVLLDPVLEKRKLEASPEADIASSLVGQVAIASAKVAYQLYKELFNSERFEKFADWGARRQRLLWASTSTKNAAYRDTKYIEPLIGPETINTLPVATLDAYRDHGQPRASLEQNISQAYHALNKLSLVGIDLDSATQQLEDEGVEKFVSALDRLILSLREKHAATDPVALTEPKK